MGKIKQNELDCRDTAPLNTWTFGGPLCVNDKKTTRFRV